MIYVEMSTELIDSEKQLLLKDGLIYRISKLLFRAILKICVLSVFLRHFKSVSA